MPSTFKPGLLDPKDVKVKAQPLAITNWLNRKKHNLSQPASTGWCFIVILNHDDYKKTTQQHCNIGYPPTLSNLFNS